MKKIGLITLLLFSSILFAQQVDSLFVEANKLYQNEAYEDALKIYKKIEETSKTFAQADKLYYNIANTNYKLNKVAPAVYYYEKALLINPTNADARFNLGFAKRMAIDNIEPLPKTISQKITDGFILKLSYNTWAWLAVSLSLLFAVLFLLYHFSYSSSSKRFYFVSSIISAFLVLLTLIFAYKNYSTITSNKPAIVFAQQADVKSAPTMSSEASFQLHEGTKVQIVESLDNWKKIKIADGKIGWMISSDLKELTQP